ncbi:hypothetical protein C8034_v002609 [Colletotrichum sidae]|uniref:DUF6594 domain-containing protein n=1 Tax=Colletotrichum sidae TaxID=1347389 RepID=A0A4R8TC15_9PEZI|nr:hypothetical protein C8034_v002609 [Colletotrichum sidae]
MADDREVSGVAHANEQVRFDTRARPAARDGRVLDPVIEHINHEERLDERGKSLSSKEQGRRLSQKPFSLRLALAGKHHLVNQTKDESEVYITLRTLQRMVLHDLQKQVTELVAKIHETNNASRERMDKARELMATYVRDYDYMVQKANEAKELLMFDPFTITSRNKLGGYLFKDTGALPSGVSIDDGAIYRRDPEMGKVWVNSLPGVTSKEITETSNQALIWERLWMGLAGGVAIIAPVLVMVLRRDLLTRLLTLGVSVFIFTFVLAVAAAKMRGETVVGLVAAYAAVIVVFIGVS